MKKAKKVKKSNKDLRFFVVGMPILFFVMIGLYLLLNNLAEKYSVVCEFIGNQWFSEIQTPDNPNPRLGCYTWDEVYR